MPTTPLSAVDLFKDTSDVERDRIARLCTERRYAAGKSVFSKGDPADALYIVEDGLVKLVSLSDKGTETIVNIFKQGNLFGELLLSEDKRSFSAVAATDARVTAIPRRNLLEILSTVPAVSFNFIRLLSMRLARVERTFAGFGHTWSYHRLAKVLLELAAEHGTKAEGGTLIAMRVTHEDLANLIGTTRETVTNQLGRFRREGLIARRGRQLVVNVARVTAYLKEE